MYFQIFCGTKNVRLRTVKETVSREFLRTVKETVPREYLKKNCISSAMVFFTVALLDVKNHVNYSSDSVPLIKRV